MVITGKFYFVVSDVTDKLTTVNTEWCYIFGQDSKK